MWVNKPESVDAAERDTAVFHCVADALPDPDYFWFLNGVPISSLFSTISLTHAVFCLNVYRKNGLDDVTFQRFLVIRIESLERT